MILDSSFHGIVQALATDTLGQRGSLQLFRPELALCITIVILLFVRIFTWGQWISGFFLALVGSVVGLALALDDAGQALTQGVARQEIFTGMLIYDSFTIYFRCLLMAFVVLFCLLTRITGIPDHEDGPDFYSLVLGATLGMSLMVSSNHMMMVFLAVEMASVPSYVLAGLLKGGRRSSEAALKYSVYGAGASGVMLYGISLLAGVLGSVHLPTMAQRLAVELHGGSEQLSVLALGGVMVMVGLAFKLSAVPFHFWCPDVFEGATAEVNAFLSVASKAAALALLVRVALGFGYASDFEAPQAQLDPNNPPVVAAGVFSVADDATGTAANAEAAAAAEIGDSNLAVPTADPAPRDLTVAALAPARSYIVQLLALVAAITCTFGNLAAYGQTNIKRLLAYSTIAHAGYMIMPVAAAVAAVEASGNLALAKDAIAALVFYITIYLFMNLGAFAIVAFLRNSTGSEELSSYAGLINRCPVIVVCFALILVSLIGLPPLAGFAGKFRIFLSLVEAGGPIMMTLLVIAGLNTAISLVFYIRVIKVMTMDPEPDSRGPVAMGFIPVAYVVAITVPVVAFGLFFDNLFGFAKAATQHLFL